MGRKLSEAHKRALTEKRRLNSDLCESLGFHSQGSHLGIEYRAIDGSLHNTKVRKGGKDFAFEVSGKEAILWNLPCLAEPVQDGETLYITEGELDGVSMLQAGFKRVVSVPNGAPSVENESGDGRFRYLFKGGSSKNLIKPLADFVAKGRIVLAVDGDKQGGWLRDQLARRINDEVCSWVRWPDGCKDANDVLVKGLGEAKLRDVVDRAEPMWNDMLGTIDDFVYRESETFGHGIDRLKFRFELPCFMVMMGPYGHGKSVFLRQLLWALWKRNGWRFLLTCLEEPIWPRIGNHFRALELNRMLSEDTVPGMPTPEEFARADSQIRRGAMFLTRPKRSLLDITTFFDMVELAVRRDGVKVVALDPVNELDHNIVGNEAHYWADFVMRCKWLADEYRLLFIACAHPPASAYANLNKRQLLRLVNTSGGATWGNKADIGMCFWKPSDESNITLLHHEKSKNHDTMGKPTLYALKHIDMGKFVFEDEGWNLWKPAKAEVA